MNAVTAITDSLWPALFQVHGYTVEYYRCGASIGTLDAIKGIRTTQLDVGEYTSTHTSDDWIFKWSDLRQSSIEPERGDEIYWTDASGDLHRNEVNLPGDERQYDFMDQHQTLVRVHTKEIFA